MSNVQKVLSGFRITLPNDFRKALKVKEGDFIIVESHEGSSLRIIPADVTPRSDEGAE